ncbi:protein hunchback-like isoform X2 [Haliotis asinina]|uniref:protein hunchback-like isoform X2 n=1 Tax=Haliotis asinina TaxID=109174 RepID=UPI003531A002
MYVETAPSNQHKIRSDAISPKVADVLEKVMSAESGLVNHEETSPHYTAHNQSAAYSNHSQDKDEANAGLPLLSNLYRQNSFCSYPDSTYSRRDSEQSDSSPQYSHQLTPSEKFNYRREETDSSNLPNPDSKFHKDEEEQGRKPDHLSFQANKYKAADIEHPAPTSFYGNALPSEENQVTEDPPYPRKDESGSPVYKKHSETNPDGPSLTRDADGREGESVLNGSFFQEQDDGPQNTSQLNSSFNDSYHSDEDSSTEGLRSGLNESNSDHLLPEDYKNYSFQGITSTPVASPGYLGNRRFSLPSTPRSIDPSSPTFNSYSKQTGLYFCHLCSFSAKCKDDFDAHMSIHFEYSCPHCDYTSRTEGRLKRHIKDFHSSDSDGFGTAKMQRMQPGRPKVYRCKQCSFASTTKVDFWQHSRSHIKEEKLLQCPRCPFVTEYKHHLEYHLRNHFGSKPFKCNKCNYSCVNKSMLNSHMKSHTNVYQYRCADCTYATKYCHSLKLHLKKYNHKPAAVLNADGSLPQGLEPETSGLSLLAKRGPPRGPRGPRKDKMDQFMSPLFHLPQSSVPGMHPGLNSSLMAPYWPLLNGMQPPPPLIPVNNMPGQMRPPQPQSSSPGKLGKGEPGSTKCNLCSFKAESPEGLHAHVLKVHAAGENQDLFSMFGISSEALLDEQNLKAHLARQRSLTKPDGEVPPTSRHNTMLHVHTDQGSTPSKTSPHSWPANQIGGQPHHRNTSHSLPELSYSSRNQQDSTSPQEPVEGADILKQMTLKFGGGGGSGGNTVTPRIRKESPLDLTKPKSVSPPAYSPLSGMHPVVPHDMPMMPVKRPFQEVDVPSSNDSTENAVPSPRKRSRKGKAYKLDTLCLKLQEKQSGSPYDSESEESSSEVPPQEYVTETRTQSVDGSPNGRGESPGSLKGERGKYSPPHKADDDMANGLTSSPITHKNDFEQIHENLKILNSGIKPEPHSPNGDSHSNFENNEQRDALSPTNDTSNADDHEGKPHMVSDYMNHQKPPMTSALRRGAELAWKILQDSGPDGAPVQNGEIVLENPRNGLHPLDTEKSLTLPSELSLNALNHSKTKPFRGADSFECHYCEIAFRDCVMYTMHMGYHGYQDPYKCNMCGHCSKDKVEFFLHIARAAHN